MAFFDKNEHCDLAQAEEEAAKLALRGCDRSRVRGIGVSGQQHGLVALGKRGAVLRPAKLWCDVTCHAEAAELSTSFGTKLVPSFTGAGIVGERMVGNCEDNGLPYFFE